MSVLTAPETALLRSRPHNTKLWLSIYQPDIIFSGRATGTVAKGSRDIPVYDTSGSSANIRNGMTLYAGTTQDGWDKGKVRVKVFSGSTGGIAENSHINWAQDDYITIVDFYEIWPVYPRIIQSPSDEMVTLWYKDWDIPYSNQNSALGYFMNMGCPHAGFVGDDIYYSANGTEHVRSDETGTSYYWDFEGGIPSSYIGITPGNINYGTVGHYTTRLIVSGSVTGATEVSYRHVSIYDRPGSGTNTPYLQWELLDLSGNREQGGYTASFRVFQSMPETQLKDGSLIVIFAEDRYGTTDQSIGGNATNRQKIVFTGYILDGTIRYNYRESYVDFDVVSPTEIMKIAEGFSISVQDSDDPAGDAATDENVPSGWGVLLDMDIKKAIHHYLKWHSTVLQCCDLQYIGTNYPIQYFDADRTSIYDAVNTLISSAVIGGITSDRQGKIYAETDLCVTTGTYNTGLSITKQDWMGDPIIDERPVNEVSYLEMGGIAYNGTTYEALLAAAPGSTPAYRGKIERIQGLALSDQAQLNTIVGNLYAQKNAKYPNTELHIAGNYRNFDIAPQEIIPLTVASTDTIRGITFNQKSFFINSMNWEYNAEDETLLPIISLQELTSGFPADSLAIPDVPPMEGEYGGFTIPPIIIPPFIIPPFPTFNV